MARRHTKTRGDDRRRRYLVGGGVALATIVALFSTQGATAFDATGAAIAFATQISVSATQTARATPAAQVIAAQIALAKKH